MNAAPTSTTSQPVQSGYPTRTKNTCPPGTTAQVCEVKPEGRVPASGGRSVGFWGRPWKFFRDSFHALSRIQFQCGHKGLEDTFSVSLEYLPFRILPVVCKFNHPPGKSYKSGHQSRQWWRHTPGTDTEA